MKKLHPILLLTLTFWGAISFAQVQPINYQGIAIDAAGKRLNNQSIDMRFSVLKGSNSGVAVYVETQSATTNSTGNYSVQIGQGNVVSGSFFTNNWTNQPYFLKVELKPAALSDYSVLSIGPIALSLSTDTTTWHCGSNLIVNHLEGTVAPVDKTVSYGTVTNIPGEVSKCWITSNLGADHQASGIYDPTEASAGWYWQFNRIQGFKNNGTVVTPVWTIGWITDNSDWTTGNDPCAQELGSGWRIPTSTEWNNVNSTGNWIVWAGPWNSGLKLHGAGYLDYGGVIVSRGFRGSYWSSKQSDASYGYDFTFDGAYYSNVSIIDKSFGFSIRCLKDN